MFVLNHARKLFLGKHLLARDKVRGGYWIIRKHSVCWQPEPVYDFQWVDVSEEEIARDYPKHYENFRHHAFLFTEKQKDMSTNYVRNQKVYWQTELYDFGYYSQVDGKAVIYKEGKSNMQDSYDVDVSDLSPVGLARQQMYENLMTMCESRKLSYGMTLREVLSILAPK